MKTTACLLAAAALVAGCGPSSTSDRYDASRMDLKPVPAQLSGERHKGPFAAGASLSLTAEDWSVIDAAFDANQDPIAGVREQDFRTLFSRIVSLAPAPVGFGDRWEKVKT